MLMRSPAHHDALGRYGTAALIPKTDLLVAMLTDRKMVSLRKGDILFHEGDRAESIVLVASGTICLHQFMPNGRRIIERFLFPRDIAGLAFDNDYPCTAECIETTTVYTTPRRWLAPMLARSSALQNEVMLLLKHDVMLQEQEILPLMHKPAEARVAHLLRLLACRNGSGFRNGEQIKLPMTRRDIADFLGITPETTVRAFRKLRETGLISAPLPDLVMIRDVDGLAALAEGGP